MLDKETENKIVNEVKDSDGVRTNTVAFRLKLERQAKEVYSFLCSKVVFWHDRINDLWYYKEERDRKRRAEKAR